MNFKKILALILLTLTFFCSSCATVKGNQSTSNGDSYIQDDSDIDLDNSSDNSSDDRNDIMEIILNIDQADNIEIEVNQLLYLTVTTMNLRESVSWQVSNDCAFVTDYGWLIGQKPGECEVTASSSGISDSIFVTVVEPEVVINPYEDMTSQEFYANYTPASSYQDALFRSERGFMSGDISEQDQEPTLSSVMPNQNGKYFKNSNELYSADGNAYYVVDYSGNIVNAVYKGGAYVTLEDVAAYVYAFGNIPANYTSNKSGSPSSNKWGKYLRLNHSKFSGSTNSYPYEPELPNISGCGGNLQYYEIDIGTTGTDCDPKYDSVIYNNGSTITRGAARIVYSRFKNSLPVTDVNDKYVFYTYNHYNDFQEYLNYFGGWGEMFGNITGGGKISSKTDYNPTPYVSVILKDFSVLNATALTSYLKQSVENYFVSYAC